VTAAIRAEGLRRRFGATQALSGLDLLVPAGSVLALLGPNGAGKSTTIRILTTLTAPHAGRAEVLGFDVTREAHRVRAVIGVAGQVAAVDDTLTGRENLTLVGRLHHLTGREARRRAGDLLERFSLAGAADRLARTYSGGMRRRLDLAASLVNRPRVLFLDEPTTGLDPASRLELWMVIDELVATGATVLLTTQYLEEADRLAHRIAVVNHGRVVAEGSADELKTGAGGEVLAVRIHDRSRLDTVAALLGPVGLQPATIDRATGEVSMPTPDGVRALALAAGRLDEAGLAVASVELRRPSLDEVFLALTSQPALTPAGGSPAARAAVATGSSGRAA